MITGAQIRQARKLVGWSAKKLSGRAKLAASTIHRAECVDGEPSRNHGSPQQLTIRTALERAGVEFTKGDEPGVQLIPEGKTAMRLGARTGR